MSGISVRQNVTKKVAISFSHKINVLMLFEHKFQVNHNVAFLVTLIWVSVTKSNTMFVLWQNVMLHVCSFTDLWTRPFIDDENKMKYKEIVLKNEIRFHLLTL